MLFFCINLSIYLLIFSTKAQFKHFSNYMTSEILTKVIRVVKHSFFKMQLPEFVNYKFEFVFCILE